MLLHSRTNHHKHHSVDKGAAPNKERLRTAYSRQLSHRSSCGDNDENTMMRYPSLNNLPVRPHYRRNSRFWPQFLLFLLSTYSLGLLTQLPTHAGAATTNEIPGGETIFSVDDAFAANQRGYLDPTVLLGPLRDFSERVAKTETQIEGFRVKFENQLAEPSEENDKTTTEHKAKSDVLENARNDIRSISENLTAKKQAEKVVTGLKAVLQDKKPNSILFHKSSPSWVEIQKSKLSRVLRSSSGKTRKRELYRHKADWMQIQWCAHQSLSVLESSYDPSEPWHYYDAGHLCM